MSRNTVTYASDYLVQRVELPGHFGFHQITLTWNRQHPEAGGSAEINPNSCGLDQFGDPTFCTLIAISTQDMELVSFAQKPGHHAYSVKFRATGSSASFADMPLRLVAIAEPGHPLRVRLLVLGPDQSIASIIELHEV